MNTNIYVITQVLWQRKWENILLPLQKEECSDTFKVLANIKNMSQKRKIVDRECLCLPKGLPDDLEHENFYISPCNSDPNLWLGEFGYSYFTLLELLETNVTFKETHLYQWITEMLELKKKYKVPLSGIRVIFGFSN